ncbi:Hypothetical protein, putative [Bodo saltans]|uniref:Uncharacterized protein n=1 Tax=Bodo saltans TaxID=75058 RepID=A0A0S4IUH2_BODSA|nr:Hypothetical protein, putative [Bodo saltans]|eukprot:CUF97293.1 Hypothetical protein, putative [Bodo saltans]
MQQCSRRSLSMGQFFQQLMLEALPMAAGGAVATWIITSLCEQLLDIHRRSIEEESPVRNEETDAARFFHQPHIPMAALNKFFCVCSPLGIHCELSDGTSKEYHTIAALQTSSLEEALGGVTGCGASRGSGVLRLPQSTLGVEALVALSKAAARARQSSRHAAVSGLHIVSKAPEAQVCQRLGLGDVMLSQLRSTARLLASVVCPVSALELHDIPTTMTGLDAFKTFAQTTQLVTMEELALDEKVVESLVCLLQPLEDADALTVDAAGVAAAVHGVESLCAASTTALPWWKRFDDIAALSRKRPRSPQPPPLSASASLKETNVLGNVSAHSSGIAPSAEAAVAALFSCEQELNSILNMTKDSALDGGVRSLITDAMRHVGQYRKDLLSPSQSHTVTASDVAKNVRIKHEVEIHEIDDD